MSMHYIKPFEAVVSNYEILQQQPWFVIMLLQRLNMN